RSPGRLRRFHTQTDSATRRKANCSREDGERSAFQDAARHRRDQIVCKSRSCRSLFGWSVRRPCRGIRWRGKEPAGRTRTSQNNDQLARLSDIQYRSRPGTKSEIPDQDRSAESRHVPGETSSESGLENRLERCLGIRRRLVQNLLNCRFNCVGSWATEKKTRSNRP